MREHHFLFRVCGLIALSLIAISAFAEGPEGAFQCRHYPQGVYGDYALPVAYLWLHADGHYELLDLTTTKGKTSGRYSYNPTKHEIHWKSGDLSALTGHYLPKALLIRLNTKNDPAGRVDGTLPCLRISSN